MRVKVRPGASRTKIIGRTELPDIGEVVVVAVAAVPEGGKANKAVIELLATALDLGKSSISVIAGTNARIKVLQVTGDSSLLFDRIASWLNTLPCDH